MGEYVLYDSIHVKKGEKRQRLPPGKSMKADYKKNMMEPSGFSLLIWAVANIAVHMCKNKEVFASVAYVMYQTVIFKELKLKQIK